MFAVVTASVFCHHIEQSLWSQRLQKLVEHWMNKYDVDVEAKQKELDILIASKAKDLERLQDLTKLVRIRGHAW